MRKTRLPKTSELLSFKYQTTGEALNIKQQAIYKTRIQILMNHLQGVSKHMYMSPHHKYVRTYTIHKNCPTQSEK
ncbi:hypothetical protein M413DRAFT_242506 [Hebeloma cylindrosporum]|uniref:Uncharacterized protein n=1 Tax=Hebeloma cylindrosporum TaxID=76867 RepID=A0A0C3BPA3_HEBCY|nr:hypothetical protein M413DRAFT_242506 [Hebeloma cylindrosporum h7]